MNSSFPDLHLKHFARASFAQETADAMQGRLGLFGDGSSGLFLAAPRRTGKSTFLRADLIPELHKRQVEVVYVDLTTNLRADPEALIAEAVARGIHRNLGPISRTAKAGAIESVQAPWFKVDLTKIGKPDGTAMADALRMLCELAHKPVALIVDEAQRALTSEGGEAAMWALKSSRDTINLPGDTKLMLVMTGSDRDKLLRLVNSNSAPFFGSSITRMPVLGKDFTDFVVTEVEKANPSLKPIDKQAVHDAFELFGARPQFFAKGLGLALNPLVDEPAGGASFEQRLRWAAQTSLVEDEIRWDADFIALRPVEQAILWRLLQQGPRFRPYDADALAFYREKTKALGGTGSTTAQTVQNALEALRQRTPSLVWKSARGEYALEDPAMQTWYAHRAGRGSWPPQSVESEAAVENGLVAAPADQKSAKTKRTSRKPR